ncbi:MAG: ABC transporter ATP-binding protein [Planctomycetota bacterium]
MIQAADRPALEIERIEKTYKKGKVRALRDARLSVARGSCFGLLGPNGAGKSTLVKSLMTVVRPNVAQGTLLDRPIGDKSVLARVGYLPEHHQFPDYLTGEQVLRHVGAMAGVRGRERAVRAEANLELVGMSGWAKKRVGSYSKGMRQRIGIAQALMNDPEIVLLDEPSDGVDPTGRRDIRNMIRDLKERGMTVFLNSHMLTELEQVCDRVAIMHKGRVVSQGTIKELTEDGRRVEIELTDAELAGRVASMLPERVDHRIEHEATVIRLFGATPETTQGVIDLARREGATIRRFFETRPSLEDLFMEAVESDASVGAVANYNAKGGEA